ncbi:MAG: MBL fold metallo-hydrolase [Armatimonadota bacterium]|nr:MAG: MBL fold metallo-hydrolase [Armatimonadota bacterium]
MFTRRLPIGPIETNAYIIAHEASREAIVIDPGGPPAPILKILKDQDFELQAIVNTHGHGDHMAGDLLLKQATGAPVWVHEADAAMLTDPHANLLAWSGFDVETAPADRTLREGDVITIGEGHADEIKLHVAHTPGHTPGGMSLIGDGVVFSGDCLFAGGIGRTDLPGGSEYQLLTSIRDKLLSLPDETIVYPGHGPETTIGEERRRNPFLREL